VPFSAGVLNATEVPSLLLARDYCNVCPVDDTCEKARLMVLRTRRCTPLQRVRRQLRLLRQNRILICVVPFQLGRRSRDWRVQQHRSFTDGYSLRSSTRQLWSYTGRATGPAPPRHRPNDRCRLLKPFLSLHSDTRTVHHGSHGTEHQGSQDPQGSGQS
jgi:hypothetical protein